jgi:hypothetical protein
VSGVNVQVELRVLRSEVVELCARSPPDILREGSHADNRGERIRVAVGNLEVIAVKGTDDLSATDTGSLCGEAAVSVASAVELVSTVLVEDVVD